METNPASFPNIKEVNSPPSPEGELMETFKEAKATVIHNFTY